MQSKENKFSFSVIDGRNAHMMNYWLVTYARMYSCILCTVCAYDGDGFDIYVVYEEVDIFGIHGNFGEYRKKFL